MPDAKQLLILALIAGAAWAVSHYAGTQVAAKLHQAIAWILGKIHPTLGKAVAPVIVAPPATPPAQTPAPAPDPLSPTYDAYLAKEALGRIEWDKPDHQALATLLSLGAEQAGVTAGRCAIGDPMRGALEKAARFWNNDAYVKIMNGDSVAWKAATSGSDHLLACFAYACSRGVEPTAYANGDPA